MTSWAASWGTSSNFKQNKMSNGNDQSQTLQGGGGEIGKQNKEMCVEPSHWGCFIIELVVVGTCWVLGPVSQRFVINHKFSQYTICS